MLGIELGELDAVIDAERAALMRLRAEAVSLQEYAPARALASARWAEVAEREAALSDAVATRTRLPRSVRPTSQRSAAHPRWKPRAHIRNSHQPMGQEQDRRTRLLRL